MSLSDDQYETEGEDSYFVSMTDIMVGMVFCVHNLADVFCLSDSKYERAHGASFRVPGVDGGA